MEHQHVEPQPGQSRPFHFHSLWDLPGQPDQIWRILADVGAWPRWWRGMTDVVVEDPGQGPHGQGTRARISVASPVGYTLRFTIVIYQVHHPWSAFIDVSGDLRGRGEWSVEATSASGVQARSTVGLTWCVVTSRAAIRMLRPLSGFAHGYVMSAGQRGLRKQLQAGEPS